MSLKKFFQREYPIVKQLGWMHLCYSVERVLNIKLHRSNYEIAQKHHRLMRRFLDKKFESFVAESTIFYANDSCNSYNQTIWILWLQGEDKAPQLVKNCIASVRKHANGHSVVVLSVDNLDEYVKFPIFIEEKYQNGIISNQNYSDLIRMYLLSHYGGLWCDATIFVTNDIPDDVFNYNFFSCKHHVYLGIEDFVPNGKWSAYLLASKPQNVVTTLEYQLFMLYWKNENHLVDYYLVDYIMDYLYRHHTLCKKQIDEIPFNNQDVFFVVDHLNEVADDSRFEEIVNLNLFQKLSWRATPNSNPDTYYNKLVKLLDY
jgi:hypothetical protein